MWILKTKDCTTIEDCMSIGFCNCGVKYIIEVKHVGAVT